MFRSLPLRSAIVGACLLQACSVPRDRAAMAIEPIQQVKHAANATAMAYYQLGKFHQERGDLELALTAYNYAISRDAGLLDARSAAAAIHAQQGRLDQAKAMLLAVIAEDAAYPQPYNNLGYVLYLRGDYADAAQMYRQALALDAGNARARNNLQLAESGLSGRLPAATAAAATAATTATAATAATAVAPEPPALAAAPSERSTLELVRLHPNIYQLQDSKAQASTAAAAPSVPTHSVIAGGVTSGPRIEVANANGEAGLARRIGKLMGARGIRVARFANARPYGREESILQYRPGYRAQAETMRNAMQGKLALSENSAMDARADLRLLLGKDVQKSLPFDQPPAGALQTAAL